MSVYQKSGHDLGRDMIILEPYVDQDAQNQSKVARVTFPFDSVPAWMAGNRKYSQKMAKKMASKWPKIAFSVPNQLSHPKNMSRCGYNVTNQSTEV